MELRWGVKASLLAYVAKSGGTVALSDGVQSDGAVFTFPGEEDQGDGVLRFRGEVALRAHGGMMDVSLRDPWLVPTSTGWDLTIVDPEKSGSRMRFVIVARLDDHDGGTLEGHGTVLSPEGEELFFGPYQAGTPFDDLVVWYSGDAIHGD